MTGTCMIPPSPVPGIPSTVESYAIDSCINASISASSPKDVTWPYTQAQVSWLSTSGDTGKETTKLPYNTTAILQWNNAEFWCQGLDYYHDNYVNYTSFQPTGVTLTYGGVTKSMGDPLSGVTVTTSTTNYWSVIKSQIFSVPTPSTGSSMVVTINKQRINQFTNNPSTGYPPGGEFECVEYRPPNSTSFTKSNGYFRTDLIDYPAAPPIPACTNSPNSFTITLDQTWTLSGSITVSSGTLGPSSIINVAPGAQLKFASNVSNKGPSPASYSWSVTNPSGSIIQTGSSNITAVDTSFPNNRYSYFTVPTNATNNTQYCETLHYTAADGPGSKGASSTACATVEVTGWTLSGKTLVSSGNSVPAVNINVAPGAKLKFTNSVQNTGSAPSTFYWIVYTDSAMTLSPSSLGSKHNVNNLNPTDVNPDVSNYFNVPSNASAGTKYCEKIYYSSATGSGTAGDNSPTACATVQKPGWLLSGTTKVFSGTASAATSINATPGSVVTFTNQVNNSGPDKASYTWSIIATGFTIVPSSLSGNNKVVNELVGANNPNNKNTYTIPTNAPDGRVYCEYVQYSNASGPNTPEAKSNEACVTVSSTPTETPVSNPCPIPPNLGINQTSDIASIYLPNITPPAPYYSALPGAPASAGVVAEVATPENSYSITQANDQYSNPTTISWSPTAGYNPNPFNLDYANYAQQYPYDPHSTTVDYNQTFSISTYISVFSYYSCPSGYTGGGTSPNCSETKITGYKAVVCPKNKPCSCPSPYHNSSYGCITTGTVSSLATPVYAYKSDGPSVNKDFSGGVYDGSPTLPEICPRNYTILPPSSTNVTSVTLTGGTADSPTSASVSQQLTVQLSLDYGPQNLRNPFLLNGIQYLGNYYIANTDGSSSPINSPYTYNFNLVTNLTTPGLELYDSANAGSPPNSQPFQPLVSFPVSVSGNPPIEVGDGVCAQFSVSGASGQVDYQGDTWSGTSPNGAITTPINCSAPVASYPYTRAYGNDVASGVKFNQSSLSCSPSTSGIFGSGYSATSSSTPQAIGSGSQFAVMSLGQIQDFASAFLRNALPTSINGLTFANDPLSGTNYGGNFATTCPSMYNYYLGMPSNVETPPGISGSSGPTYNIHSISSPVSLSGFSNYVSLVGSSINNTHVIYVNGNVYIPNNITYNTSNLTYNANLGVITNVPGGNTTNAPDLYVIASGNIYIGPNVTQLDGVYIAESSCDVGVTSISSCSSTGSSGGLINTCADLSNITNVGESNSAAFPTNSLFSNCANQLTINGSLVGDTIDLERTFASIRNSSSGENPLNGNTYDCSLGNGSVLSSNSGCSSEVFNFDPVNYMGNPALQANQNGNFDSILSLPPVL